MASPEPRQIDWASAQTEDNSDTQPEAPEDDDETNDAGEEPDEHDRDVQDVRTRTGELTMTKDHGPSVKNDKQYEGLRKKGMSKERAAKIANSPGSSKRGGKSSGSGTKRNATTQGGTKAQKAAAGRKGGKKSS